MYVRNDWLPFKRAEKLTVSLHDTQMTTAKWIFAFFTVSNIQLNLFFAFTSFTLPYTQQRLEVPRLVTSSSSSSPLCNSNSSSHLIALWEWVNNKIKNNSSNIHERFFSFLNYFRIQVCSAFTSTILSHHVIKLSPSPLSPLTLIHLVFSSFEKQ